jgi:pectate lyase
VLAPSTPAGVALGFLVTRSRFLAEPGTPVANISLGRAWDEGVARGAWQAGVSPNGQALIRDSLLGPHLALQAPWAASTSRRPFTASGPQAARMAEFNNTTLAGHAVAREVLPAWGGWGAAAGGVQGGATAAPGDVHTVRTRAQLLAALLPHPSPNTSAAQRPRIVQVVGRIDLHSDDQGQPLPPLHFADPAFNWPAYEAAYAPATWGTKPPEGPLEDARKRSARRHAEHVTLRVPSRTTLIGVGRDAQLVGGMVLLPQVQDVIVRNLRLSDAHDPFPAWDPKDNAAGEWNSELDNLSLRGARHVWVDHCSFDDGQRPDSANRSALGRPLQHHDGLLDITQQSTHVTVSWNHFAAHDKTSLVGSSDNTVADEGQLRVTYHHNHWDGVKERAPRVRYGQVHLFNNLHTVPDAAGYGYSIGIGHRSRIFSEHNAWETPPQVPASKLARVFKGHAFVDRGSLHNGQPLQLLQALSALPGAAPLSADVGWSPTQVPVPDPAAAVPARVRAGAGAGRLEVAPD